MCGGGSTSLGLTELSTSLPREVGKEVFERSRKRKQSRPMRDEDYQSKNRGGDGQQPLSTSTSCNATSLASPVKRLKRVMTSLGTSYSVPTVPSEDGDQGDKVISLLEKKKKLVKKD